MLRTILKKILPRRVLLFYYQVLAYSAAFFYNWPSQKMIIIGVTGTSGKSTVVNLIGRILEEAGFKVGWTTTFNFKIANKEWINKTKMTMLGRFGLQRMLKQMIRNGCQYAIIETSSQGIIQSRHLGIDYDLAIFTNLTAEHIESHGSFEKYRQAKQQLFKRLSGLRKRINGKIVEKISIINLNDQNAEYFSKFPVDKQYGYGINLKPEDLSCKQKIEVIKAEDIKLNANGSEFIVNNKQFKINLLGKFNVINSLSAISAALSQGIDLSICQQALEKIKVIPGRMEVVVHQPFTVIVDYAHTPDSLKKVYQTLKNIGFSDYQPKLIGVLGAAGGGRDKWKRPKLGELANQYCDYVIVTNEDSYNEKPKQIIEQIVSGIEDNESEIIKGRVYKILDRREAIRKAFSIAQPKDIVVITGKGCEQCIMGRQGRKNPWDDRQVVKELLS